MASKIFLVSFDAAVVAEKEGSHMGGVSIRGMPSGLGLRTKNLFTKLPRDLSLGPMVGVPMVGVEVENETKLPTQGLQFGTVLQFCCTYYPTILWFVTLHRYPKCLQCHAFVLRYFYPYVLL